ncbi:MAG: YfhO family protein [Firmicutes bacterium]|nr:YfhO family protein [Bacillota bacterium]
MSSKKKQRKMHKKASEKAALNVKPCGKNKYSEYMPIAVSLITAVSVFLLTLFWSDATTAFRIIFSCGVGLLFGGAFLAPEAVEAFGQKHGYIYIVMSGAISFIGLLSIFAFMGIYPFGEYSVANSDMSQQYIPFYASARRALLGGGNILYSQNLGMGGGYWSLAGYYLCSPFVLLSVLFPSEALPDFMAVQELIKLALAGCSFAYFYSRKFNRNDITVVIASLCYSMSSFMMLHVNVIVWTDCLVLLPLLALGTERIIKGGKPTLYIICLTVALISNYYIAYMLCIYLLIYYIVSAFIANEKFDLKKTGVSFLKFAGSSLLSAGMAAFVLLPSAFALKYSANAGDEAAPDLLALNPMKILSQFMYNSEFSVLSDDAMPLVYCSIFALTLLPMFFACKAISSRVKISFGCLAGFLFVSLAVNKLNFIWHGMHIPNMLPYRFSFLLCFTLLIIAGYVMEHFDGISSNAFTFGLIGLIIAAAAIYFIDGAENMVMLVATLILAVAYTVIFVMRSEKKLHSAAAMTAALAVLFVELTTNGALAWKNFSHESSYSVREDYISDYIEGEKTVSQIKVSDSDIYRIELFGQGTFNDGAMMGYSSLSHFSSTNNGRLMNLLRRMGYNCDGNVAYYYKSFTPLMDSVLNLKYVVYDEDVGDPPYLDIQACGSENVVYRNTLALPRAFAVSDELVDWNIEQQNPFDVQNDFVKKALGTEKAVYCVESLAVEEALTAGVRFDGGSVEFSESGGMLALKHTADSRKHIYAYINCHGASRTDINIGENQYHFDNKDAYIMDLGYCDKGQDLALSVASNESLSGYIAVASLDEAALEESIARLGKLPAEFTEYSDTHIACEVNAEEDCLLFTSIPYEKGWSVYVNGKKTDAEAVGGGLLGVSLGKGQNTVELKYFPRGLSAGMVISFFSLMLAVVLLFRSRIIDFFKRLIKN